MSDLAITFVATKVERHITIRRSTMAKTFIISDESINSYGFRILNQALKIDNFRKNPIGLWNHTRTWRGTKDEVLPICRWENLRLDGGQWKAEPVFDMNDEFAAKIADKVEQGIISACSIGIRIMSWSDEPQYLLQGQTRPTVVLCELQEISITDIPSNKSCISLYDQDGNQLELSDNQVEQLLPLLNLNNDDNMKLFDSLLAKLGLSDRASEEQVLTQVQTALDAQAQLTAKDAELTAKDGEIATLKTQLKAFTDAEEAAKDKKCSDLVEKALADKKILADAKDHWLNLARLNYDSTAALLDKMSAPKELGGEGGDKGGKAELSAWEQRQAEIRAGQKK
jgi:hypothetical protein